MPNLTPADRIAWRGIVTLLEWGNVSELNVASLSRSKAVLAVDARLTALEAVAAELQLMLDRHRNKAIVVCDMDCMCWKIENLILHMESM